MKPSYLHALASLMHLASSGNNPLIAGVSVDSRLTLPGDLFFALPGEKTDGHAHLEGAAAKGAVAAVVKPDYAGPSYHLTLILSQDPLASLQLLAHNLLKKSHAKVVAVTGSLGKTTTKDFIASLLKTRFHVFSSPGNSNSQIGLPLAILNHATLDEDFLILEMGMTLPGHIAKLVSIAPPSLAVVTSVALVHACNFDSIEQIAEAKAEIFSHPATEVGIYPFEQNFGGILSWQTPSSKATCRKLSFSTYTKNANYYLENIEDGMTLQAYDGNKIKLPSLNIPGAHNCHNFLAAAAASHYLGLSLEEIREALPHLQLPERRMQIVERHGATFVNDSYNAAEASVKSALSSLPKPKENGRTIAVLGEMMELGKFSWQCHAAVGKYALDYVDCLFCFGQQCEPMYQCWQQLGRHVFWTLERSALMQALRKEVRPGDVVLLKGSSSKSLWKVLEEW